MRGDCVCQGKPGTQMVRQFSLLKPIADISDSTLHQLLWHLEYQYVPDDYTAVHEIVEGHGWRGVGLRSVRCDCAAYAQYL